MRVVLLDADRRSIIETQVASQGLVGELIGAESLEAVYRGRGFVILAGETGHAKKGKNGIMLVGGGDDVSPRLVLGSAVAVSIVRNDWLDTPPSVSDISSVVMGWIDPEKSSERH